jgi:hypothetical protein
MSTPYESREDSAFEQATTHWGGPTLLVACVLGAIALTALAVSIARFL